MIGSKKIIIVVVSCSFLLPFAGAAGFYMWFGNASKRAAEEYQLGAGAANAIKHAYAAASSYQLLRELHFSAEQAAGMVRYLGHVNEHAERVTKFMRPDSVAETAKDLLSNEIGIHAARQLEALNRPASTIGLLQHFSQQGCLPNSEKIFTQKFAFHAPPSSEATRLELALRWFESNRNQMAKHMKAKCKLIH